MSSTHRAHALLYIAMSWQLYLLFMSNNLKVRAHIHMVHDVYSHVYVTVISAEILSEIQHIVTTMSEDVVINANAARIFSADSTACAGYLASVVETINNATDENTFILACDALQAAALHCGSLH